LEALLDGTAAAMTTFEPRTGEDEWLSAAAAGADDSYTMGKPSEDEHPDDTEDDIDPATMRQRWEALKERQSAVFRRIEALECSTHKSTGFGREERGGKKRGGKRKQEGGGRVMGGSDYISNTGKSKGALVGGRGGSGGRGGRGRGGYRGKPKDSDGGGGGSGDDDDSNPVGIAGGPAENYVATDDPISEEFWEDSVSWLHKEMLEMPIAQDYPDILAQAVDILNKWRDAFPKAVWIRVVKSGRIAKELNECAPVIARTRAQLEKMPPPESHDKRANVVDLCSGFGYMGMFLAEMLDPTKVQNIILVDKQWPMFNQQQPLAHQINWDHIYGVGDWKPTWPIKLFTRKSNIKEAAQLRQMEKHLFQKWSGPYIILAVHLCGTLSIKAVEMFNHHATAATLCLKPCCLPEWDHTFTHDAWNVGGHCIPTREVCAKGKWKANRWVGPPRSHLRGKFTAWAQHLYEGIDVSAEGKRLEKIVIQSEGGHQNMFIFAERDHFETTPTAALGKYGGEGYRGPGDHVDVPLTFPTADKTPMEAGRWSPDGLGHGTHVLLSATSTRGR
jgi:hypothetical protein